jgi:hypothetical protein
VTLKSIQATRLGDSPLLVIDDCSDDAVSRSYIQTNELLRLSEPVNWPGVPEWGLYVGRLVSVARLRGIAGKVEVVQPETRKGVRGGVFWCIDYLFTRFPDQQEVILVEADAVFHHDWLSVTCKAYEECRDKPGPNGNKLGLLSCYDRKGNELNRTGWRWRSVKKKDDGTWGCNDGIGGVMYLVTRDFYNAAKATMKATHNPNARGGDTMLQGLCGTHGFNIAVTVPSMCQHIGVSSTAWPEKGWRYTRNFRRPFAFETFVDGRAVSEDWYNEP